MPENYFSEEIKKLWPNNAPSISNIQKYVEKYKEDTIVIKYGGNVLIDREVFNNFILDIQILNRLGLSIVVVHGGGPRIKRELENKRSGGSTLGRAVVLIDSLDSSGLSVSGDHDTIGGIFGEILQRLVLRSIGYGIVVLIFVSVMMGQMPS